MAEVEQVAPVTVTAGASATEIPSTTGDSIDAGVDCGANDLGTSPTQEPSSNSHPHDSEYDTASDLEGGDEYDEDEDDLDDDDDLGESMTDDDEDDDEYEDEEPPIDNKEKPEIETQKKVDEDRSNPQYIPKRGTFYEHDDRTIDGEGDGSLASGATGECKEGSIGAGGKSQQQPTISHASKTMKKWQPASGVERWSHDRFDLNDQAPKSRQELVSSYGYDIRTEDAPPRARRRRRYGRGPSKYNRNWEDENAYLKASNKERKPPRPSDFPALNERGGKQRKTVRDTREEKENRLEKRLATVAANAIATVGDLFSPSGQRPTHPDERKEPRMENRGPKNKSYGRQSGQPGRQPQMDFKQKQGKGQQHQQGPSNSNSLNSRLDQNHERQSNRSQSSNNSSMNEQQKSSGKNPNYTKQMQSQQNDAYNLNKVHDNSYSQMPQQPSVPLMQSVPTKTTPPSNLSQRLQQVQNRNDPSHVGSVQMHALATQNQMVNQQQQQHQQQGANVHISPQQNQQVPQEQRGPPKRYSSLRRSQHDAQHLAEQHQMQQIHLQQQQPLMLQDQHMMQANLMQLYHQENLQAQMQALQVSQPPTQPKQPYTTVPPGAPPPAPYGGTTGTPAAPPTYYVATPDAYTATAATNTQPPQAAPYVQPPPNYIAQPQAPAAAATLSYTSGPAAPPVGPPPAAAAPQTTPNANQNYPNYQNYNTVGGTTYFVPPAQATTRPVVLPQRRPTNAIPILPPSEKNKLRNADAKEDLKNGGTASTTGAPIGSAENIDHIIDNMFVQRPAFQPPQTTAAQTRKSSTPPNVDNNSGANDATVAAAAAQTDDGASIAIADKAINTVECGPAEISNNNNAIAAQE